MMIELAAQSIEYPARDVAQFEQPTRRSIRGPFFRKEKKMKINNYTIRTVGEQGNPNWRATAPTLLGAMRKARKVAAPGINYVVFDPEGHPVKRLTAWRSPGHFGHAWADVG